MSADRGPRRIVEGLLGLILIAAFFALNRTSNTIEVTFVPPWDASSPGELYFWLAALMLLFPGAALVGVGVSPLLGATLVRARGRLAALEARELRTLLATGFVLCWCAARLGNQLWMHGQPFTDDEEAARFGGQILAEGALWAPLPPMRFAFPELFLFQRGDHWTSFDFLGAVATWALAEWTRSETLVFSLLAALAVPSITCAVTRRQGAAHGLAAGLLVLCSPMALTLSVTSHAHVVSRGLISLGFGIVLFVEHASVARGFAAGLAFGLAFATRPPEATALLGPLAAGAIYVGWRDPSERPRLLGLALGVLPGLLATFAYNLSLGGSLGFLRGAANDITVPYAAAMRGPFAWSRWDDRFGNNLAYNVLTLSIWFLGPVGLPLAWLGARTSRTHRLLGCGVLLAFSLCMLHDDRGLHMVGPIHLSETVLPLAILASAGLTRAMAALRKLEVSSAMLGSAWLSYLSLGLLTFALWHMRALEAQSWVHAELTRMVEDVPRRPAIVLTPPYRHVRDALGAAARVGGFVFEWRRARPDLSDEVLVLHDSPEARAEVGRRYPGRATYVLDPARFGGRVVPLSQLESTPLTPH